jgi:PAS domain S-box-containing protein
MKTQSLTNHFDLRQKAEERLRGKKSKLDLTISEKNLLTLNHELQVHQIELEMQNDELEKAIDIADEMSTKYIDLYNLAPTGYISLTKEGEIIEANNSAYDLLGRKHPKLIGSRFGFFVSDESKPVFNQFVEDILVTKKTETCVISLNIYDDINTHVLLTGHITKNNEFCLVAVIDISELIANQKKITQLESFNNIFIDRELKMVELKKEINQLLKNAGIEKKY